MTAVRINLLMSLAATTVWLWMVALCALWGKFFGLRYCGMLLCVSASLAAFAVAMAIPGQFFRLLLALGQRLKRTQRPSGVLAKPADDITFEGRAVRFWGWSLICSAAMSLVSAAAILAVIGLYGRVVARLLLVVSLRDILQWLAMAVAMLGWAVGAAIVCRAQSRFAMRMGQNLSAAVLSWLMGAAFAAVIIACALIGGIDPLGIALGCCAAQMFLGIYAVNQLQIVEQLPDELPERVSRHSVLSVLTAVSVPTLITIVAIFELNIISQLLNIYLSEAFLCIAIFTAAAALLGSRWHDMHFWQSAKVAVGAWVLATIALIFQLSVAAVGSSTAPLAAIAAMGGIFPAAAAVVILLNNRRRFVLDISDNYLWFKLALAGVALALAGVCWQGGWLFGRSAVISIMIVSLASEVLCGVIVSRKMARQLIWGIFGTVIIVASSLAMMHAPGEGQTAAVAMNNSSTPGNAFSLSEPLCEICGGKGGIARRLVLDGLQSSGDGENLLGWLVVDACGDLSSFSSAAGCVFASLDGRQLSAALANSHSAVDFNCLLYGKLRRFSGIYYSPGDIDSVRGRQLYSRRYLHRLTHMLGDSGTLMLHVCFTDAQKSSVQRLLGDIASLDRQMAAVSLTRTPADSSLQYPRELVVILGPDSYRYLDLFAEAHIAGCDVKFLDASQLSENLIWSDGIPAAN